MSRSGYSDDCDDPLKLGRWRAIIASAIRGKRGQAFFRALLEALESMPDKRLISSELIDDSGCMCALGALAKHRGINPSTLNTYDYDELGATFDITHQLSQEVMYANDYYRESPEDRWQRMRDWAASQIRQPA